MEIRNDDCISRLERARRTRDVDQSEELDERSCKEKHWRLSYWWRENEDEQVAAEKLDAACKIG